MSPIDRMHDLRDAALRLLRKLEWLAPALARGVVGWVFLESVWGKLHTSTR